MKKLILISILILSILLTSFRISYANCGWALEAGVGTWTVASNCTVSNGLYSVWDDVIVWSRTVTIASDAALLLDWANNKMTFTTWKVNMSWNGVMYWNHSEFTWYSNNTGGAITNCPAWKTAWNPITRWNATTRVHASERWYIVCK